MSERSTGSGDEFIDWNSLVAPSRPDMNRFVFDGDNFDLLAMSKVPPGSTVVITSRHSLMGEAEEVTLEDAGIPDRPNCYLLEDTHQEDLVLVALTEQCVNRTISYTPIIMFNDKDSLEKALNQYPTGEEDYLRRLRNLPLGQSALYLMKLAGVDRAKHIITDSNGIHYWALEVPHYEKLLHDIVEIVVHSPKL